MKKNILIKRAIIVDDFKALRDIMTLKFRSRGFDTLSFDNETHAMNALKEFCPHIAYIHFSENMRRSTNFIRKIHKKYPTISILYSTAYKGENVSNRAYKAGAFTVIHKPFEPNIIEDAIKNGFEESVRKKLLSNENKDIFVLMPFANKYDRFYEDSIKTPIEMLGLACNRVDDIQFTGNIMTEVYKNIEHARLIIADMSERNPNVFYEVGYAHAISKSVILLTNNVDDIPFDLKNQRHIIYGNDLSKFEDELLNNVKAIL